MDRLLLSSLDEELDSFEVADLCFLCSDFVNRKRLEGIRDAKGLFIRLEEKGLLENPSFLSQLLQTIHRADLLHKLETGTQQQEEVDSSPILSEFRVMLYNVYQDMTSENLNKLKFLLTDKLAKRQLENSSTALDVFAEMEKMGLISKSNVNELHALLLQFDQQLAQTVQDYINSQPFAGPVDAPVCHQEQSFSDTFLSQQPVQQIRLPSCETEPNSGGEYVCDHAQELDEGENYLMTHIPRGLCVIINNENFKKSSLRPGTQQDVAALSSLFEEFGFRLEIHNDRTAEDIRNVIKTVSTRNFLNDDILVIFVLTHGEEGCILGTDDRRVPLTDLTASFTGDKVPSLAGKPKLFFIQACQGHDYQRGTKPCLNLETSQPEFDGPVTDDTLPVEADLLMGMSTLERYRSFRNKYTGSLYIQELCNQLRKSAESQETDDILSVLTRVHREISRGCFSGYKQMPELRHTLTKKLILRFVSRKQVQNFTR